MIFQINQFPGAEIFPALFIIAYLVTLFGKELRFLINKLFIC